MGEPVHIARPAVSFERKAQMIYCARFSLFNARPTKLEIKAYLTNDAVCAFKPQVTAAHGRKACDTKAGQQDTTARHGSKALQQGGAERHISKTKHQGTAARHGSKAR